MPLYPLLEDHHVHDAVSRFNRMFHMRRVPSIIEFDKILGSLVEMKHYRIVMLYAKAIIWTEQLKLFNKMIEKGIQPDMSIYNVLIDGMCKGEDLNMQELFQDLFIKDSHLDVRTYNVMIHGFCKEGLIDEALALWSQMEDNGCMSSVVTFKIITRALFEKDEIESRKFLREMITRGFLK
ncbi:unnamed protein product [Sphenostylis stenocarpa]|uniref:Pentatricopeptide repeat-containing protein n=1 Tax=Sphenostylis stenocarpa TaxID=92480 RepID=A0AA86ST65_9FABA|nr:unnamed protein product [Sphenostylis stenocarpa]